MFETGFLRFSAWAVLVVALLWGVPQLGEETARGDGVGMLIPLAIVGGGLSYWAVVLAFAGIADNVKRMADRIAPPAKKQGGIFDVPERPDGEDDALYVAGHRVPGKTRP